MVRMDAGPEWPIMQRSLIHEVSQVSGPCPDIHPSHWPPATLTWSNGHCRLMLISPHHTWRLNQGVSMRVCLPAWLCFNPQCKFQRPRLRAPCMRRAIVHLLPDRSLIEALCFSRGTNGARVLWLASDSLNCIPNSSLIYSRNLI